MFFFSERGSVVSTFTGRPIATDYAAWTALALATIPSLFYQQYIFETPLEAFYSYAVYEPCLAYTYI